MTRTDLQYCVLALAFAFLIAVFRNRAPLWKRLFVFSAPVVCILCCAVNLGSAYFGYTPKWYHILTTALYVLFWLAFTLQARRSRFMTKVCLFMSCAMLCAAVAGLGVRALDWEFLTIPAILLTPFSSLPMYGVCALTSWTGLELVSLTLAIPWLGYSLFLRRRQK